MSLFKKLIDFFFVSEGTYAYTNIFGKIHFTREYFGLSEIEQRIIAFHEIAHTKQSLWDRLFHKKKCEYEALKAELWRTQDLIHEYTEFYRDLSADPEMRLYWRKSLDHLNRIRIECEYQIKEINGN